jgi:hypothetical protein
VLHREHATNGGAFDGAKKKTSQRQGQQVIEVGRMYCWKAKWWQPLGHFAQQFHAEPAEIHARSRHNPGDDNE